MDRRQDRGHIMFRYGPLFLLICLLQGWGLSVSQSGQEKAANSHLEQINRLKQQELTILRELVRDCPNRLDPQILLARTLYRQGRGEEAVKIWKAILKQHPKRTDIYNSLGLAAFKKGEYKQAITYWQQALQVNPKLPNAHSQIAKALLSLGRHEEAIAAFHKEIEISPKSALNHFFLAQLFLQQNQVTRAKEYYERAFALNPKMINAYYGLFQVHSRLQEHEQAQQYLKAFKQLNTKKQQARRQGIIAFDDLAKTKNDAAQTFAMVGKLYLGNRKLDKAEAALRRVITLAPKKSAGYRDLVYLLLQTGQKRPEALTLAQKSLSLERTAANYFAHGYACQANRDFVGASTSLERAVALEPKNQTYRRALDNLRKRGLRP